MPPGRPLTAQASVGHLAGLGVEDDTQLRTQDPGGCMGDRQGGVVESWPEMMA